MGILITLLTKWQKNKRTRLNTLSRRRASSRVTVDGLPPSLLEKKKLMEKRSNSSSPDLVIRLSSSGDSMKTRTTKKTENGVDPPRCSLVTLTSLTKSASPLTEDSASPPLGMVPSDSGTPPLVKPSPSSLVTPEMFSPSLSPPIADKSSPVDAITKSRSGTSRPNANTPLTKTLTPMPSHVSDSTTPRSPLSASPPLGIRPSRSGTTPTQSSDQLHRYGQQLLFPRFWISRRTDHGLGSHP